MSSTEANYSFTSKVNGDLLTVRGDSVDEFKHNLETLVTSGAIDYVKAVQDHAKGDPAAVVTRHTEAQAAPEPQGKWAVAPQPAPNGAAAWANTPAGGGVLNTPQSPSGPPTGQSCRHGARVFKEGVSKAGKPYKLWACPGPRNDQCQPEWAS